MKKTLFSIIIALLLLIEFTWAGPSASTGPSAEAQQSFTNEFWNAQNAGPEAAKAFSDKIYNQPPGTESDQQVRMLDNLSNGKAADGTEAKGYRGDPTDPGPSDWSDWEFEKNANGQITGFKEKDFDKKDTDGDGKISKQERDAWKKKKEKEDKERGGPPGQVRKNPDWDKDGNGYPDPGFSLMCYNCFKSPPTAIDDEEDQCHGSNKGACSNDSCSTNENCEQYSEKDKKGKEHFCHNCNPKDACGSAGFFSDNGCEGKCVNGFQCVPADVDKSGKAIPENQTRERGSTTPCFICKKRIVIEYYVLIIETPFQRFVLGQKPSSGFTPNSVLALAKSEPDSGKIKNIVGDLRNVTDFMGGFNVGLGPGGIATSASISMDQLTNALGKGLSGGGNYGDNCFDDIQNEADQNAASQGLPSGKEIKEGRTKTNENNKKEKSFDPADIKKAEDAGTPAISGPIVSCGQENGNKVLKIYSAGGELVDTVTKAMLKANPNILLEKIGLAQSWTDKLMMRTGFDFAGYVEKFTGLPLKNIQSQAAQIQDIKSKADAILAKKQKRNKKEPEAPTIPNDPLYQAPKKKERGFFGGEAPKTNIMGTQIGVILPAVEAPKKEEIPDQYSLRKIGFTPISDPNSAWNVIEGDQKNMVVAVIDSGLDLTHPDGPQYLWSNTKEIPNNHIDDDQNGFIDDVQGWNFIEENQDLTDHRGHGTFVTGIIAARTNNGIGIAGINPGAVIMPIKAADEEGRTDSLAIYRAINYAVNHGAKIINISLGGRSISKLEQQAVERAYSMGALVIIAAGNGGENLMTFGPASSKHALTVGMLDADGARSNVSNWGANLSLTAPGERIYSLCSKDIKKILPSIRKLGYYQQDGTSFTTPMVAGTASLVWAKNPQLTNEEVRDILISTAKPTSSDQWSAMTGAGQLDAAAALRAATDKSLIVMITNMHMNRDSKDNLSSIDLYGTVKGRFKEITIEAGKGKLARSFNKIAGPYQTPYNYQFITRLVIKDVLRGSNEWIIRIKVVDESGQEHIASMPLTIPSK